MNKSIQLNKSDLERTFFDKKALEKPKKKQVSISKGLDALQKGSQDNSEAHKRLLG